MADISDKPPIRGMEDIRDLFARNLRRLRYAAQLSQETLADLAGINRGYMSDLERGRYNVSIKKLGSLADALGVEPAELLRRNSTSGS